MPRFHRIRCCLLWSKERAGRCLASTSLANMRLSIVHIGQAVLTFCGTMDYFRDTVFNYPTFAEANKVAGLDGLNKL